MDGIAFRDPITEMRCSSEFGIFDLAVFQQQKLRNERGSSGESVGRESEELPAEASQRDRKDDHRFDELLVINW